MANVRIFAFLLVLLIIINCALARAGNVDDLVYREKRFLFGCAKSGKKCSGFRGKSCCSGLQCHTLTGKCVHKGSPTSWLADRNGK